MPSRSRSDHSSATGLEPAAGLVVTAPPRPARRWAVRSLVVGLAVALAPALSPVLGDVDAADPIDPVDVPSVVDVEADLATARAEREAAAEGLAAAEGSLAEAIEARSALAADRQRLALELDALAAQTREVAVQAFTGGGALSDARYLVTAPDVADVSWRQYLLRNHGADASVAAAELRAMRAEVGADVAAAVETSDALRADAAEAQRTLVDLDADIAELEALLPVADAWEWAERAVAEGRHGETTEDRWAALRFCESSGDYRALNESGKYRGAYQFDLPTWRSVGGIGDPAAAAPAEQDGRARALYALRGSGPWPECGYLLD